MSELFNRNFFFVKERVGLFKWANAYDLFDENGGKIGEVKEDVSGLGKKLLHFIGFSRFPIDFFDATGNRIMGIRRPFAFFMPKFLVEDHDGQSLGTYQKKISLLKPQFRLFDPSGALFANLKGDWKGWNFTLEDQNGVELAKVTKKWAGLGKEMFTSADNYVISISQPDASLALRKVILAAGIGIDMALKEKKD